MRKLFSLIVILALLINSSLLFSYATDTGSLLDIHISGHNGLSTTRNEGETFPLTLELTSNSSEPLSNIYITFLENDSFYPVNSGSNIAVPGTLDNSQSKSVGPINILYSGGSGQRMSIRITYTKGTNTYSVTDYIGIKTAKNLTPTQPIETDTSKFAPRLVFNYANNTTVEAGKNISMPITLSNTNFHTAQNITITPTYEGDKMPFEFNQVTALNNFYTVYGNGSTTFYLNFVVSPTAPDAIYPIKLNLKYTNVYGDSYSSTETIHVKVINKNTMPKFTVTNISLSPEQINPGESVNLSFALRNIGNLSAKDIKVTLDGLTTNGLTIMNTSNVKYIPRIFGNNLSTVSYTIHASDKIERGQHGLDVKIEYKDDQNKTYEETHKIFVPVQGSGGSNSRSIPKLIVDQYSSSPNMVKAGENFNLNISFFNTHSDKAIQNIKIFLTVDEKIDTSGNVFTPVNSSNTFFIDYIGPKSRVNKGIQLFTVPDAKQKTYTITANFEYEDMDGNEFKASELIGIPVIQPTRLETSELNIPPFELFVGQTLPISLEFYNMGKVTLYNLMVKTEGNFHVEHGNYFVGNFESGNRDYYEAYIIPMSPGELQGSVVFSYDDPAGEKIEIRKDFTANVIQMNFEERPPDFYEPFPPPKNNRKLIWGGSAIALLLAGAAAFFIIRRRKNKQKGMFLDE